MWIEEHIVVVASDGDGDGVGYTPPVTGRVLGIHYVKDSYAAGVDIDVSTENFGVALWSEDDVNASKSLYPRVAVQGTDGVDATLDGTRPMLEPAPVADERIKITVAQAGASKSGQFTVLVG
jgi:hypothetical protein